MSAAATFSLPPASNLAHFAPGRVLLSAPATFTCSTMLLHLPRDSIPHSYPPTYLLTYLPARPPPFRRTMEQAFGDLAALMSKAQDMVKLAEYFKERMAAKKEGVCACADAWAA